MSTRDKHESSRGKTHYQTRSDLFSEAAVWNDRCSAPNLKSRPMPGTIGNSVWACRQQQQGFMAETLLPGGSTFCFRENLLEHQSVTRRWTVWTHLFDQLHCIIPHLFSTRLLFQRMPRLPCFEVENDNRTKDEKVDVNIYKELWGFS